MRRARGSEMAQRVSTRGPAALRTSSSDSDPLHHRPMTDRSPKLGDRRSPRSVQSEPISQKKLGTRIAGLETQLEQAQGELKILKDQLASAEAAKKEAQKELEKRATKPILPEPVPEPEPVSVQDTRSSPSEHDDSNKEMSQEHETSEENQKETDVFEVPVEKIELSQPKVNVSVESPEKPRFEELLAVKNEEIRSLKLKLEEKEKKVESINEENKGLKQKLTEANVEICLVNEKEEKTKMKLNKLEEEFEKSKTEKLELQEKLKEVEVAKEVLETEMKRLRVQTEQWKKAADAAAAILSGGVEMNDGRRVSERCGSMEKHYGGGYDGYAGFVGSPGMGMGYDESDDGYGNGNGKRKGSGIKMFGDLWKKKGNK